MPPTPTHPHPHRHTTNSLLCTPCCATVSAQSAICSVYLLAGVTSTKCDLEAAYGESEYHVPNFGPLPLASNQLAKSRTAAVGALAPEAANIAMGGTLASARRAELRVNGYGVPVIVATA